MEITALELSDKLRDEIRPLARKVFMANVANGVAQLSNKQASTIARPTELWFYTRYKTGHFGDVSPCQSPGLVRKKLNLTQQKHAFTNQKKCTTNGINTKAKARFSHLL